MEQLANTIRAQLVEILTVMAVMVFRLYTDYDAINNNHADDTHNELSIIWRQLLNDTQILKSRNRFII